MENNLNILLIPADDRPVSYILPLQIGAINKNIKMFSPPRDFLGNLNQTANTDKIFEWLKKTLSENHIDHIICALDTIAYGGLIPSRRSNDSEELIYSRLNDFRQAVEPSGAKILGFSSILRLADSNVNEEEKPYWDKYGKLLFKYLYLKHKGEDYSTEQAQIPQNILDDYLATREKNFSINKIYIEWQQQGFFDFLLYAKDDTAPYGPNVQEAEELAQHAVVHTGFDEVISILLTRALNTQEIRIFPIYSTPDGQDIIPRYEDKPLYKNIENHIKICNAKIAESQENADMVLLVHTPEKIQNDHALEEYAEPDNENAINFCVDLIKNSDKPVIIADLKNANGADDMLVKKLLDEDVNLYGYAGWNTASNSIGTAVSMGIMRYISEKTGAFSSENFNKLIFIRFADDWAYQTVIRKMLRKFNLPPEQINLCFPWNRTFEIEIK